MEKRWLMLVAVALLFSMMFSVSAEIIFNQQPKEVYNIGDSISIPLTVKALSEISDNLYLTLICSGKQIKFFENGVDLKSGEEVKMSAVLSKDKVATSVGDCKIKAIFGDDYALTNDFVVSNLIVVQSKIDKTDYNPGETIVFNGEAFKSNGDGANGFVKFSIITNDTSSLEVMDTVNNGYFSISLALPSGLKAGAYLVRVEVYELNSNEEQTNKGFMNYNINVNQVPTSLEIVMDDDEIEPGSTFMVKAILHDQTGEKMDSNVILTIKKSHNEILKQVDLKTDEFLEYDIVYNEAPSNWSVFAVSNMLDSERVFYIKEKRDISVEILNGTVVFTNKGNVPYNDSVLVKLGENSSVNIDINLAVDESKKYGLKAPNGEYSVEVLSNGESKFTGNVVLTGKSVDFKELKDFNLGSISPIIWIFTIFIIGFVIFIIFKKGYRRSFFGRFKFKKKHKPLKSVSSMIPMKDEFFIKTKNRAKLSLSIKGDKQESVIVCFRAKNIGNLDRKGISETMQKIAGYAEANKAMVYENNDSLFFIFSPLKTKTFRNEKGAIELSQKINEILAYHNKLFKDKFNYGISIDVGYLVGKINSEGELEFVSMGNLIPNLKKIASLKEGEILLSKEFKEKAGTIIKAQDFNIDGMRVYAIREMRDREKYNKFINAFLSNLERDKKEREKRERKD